MYNAIVGFGAFLEAISAVTFSLWQKYKNMNTDNSNT